MRPLEILGGQEEEVLHRMVLPQVAQRAAMAEVQMVVPEEQQEPVGPMDLQVLVVQAVVEVEVETRVEMQVMEGTED
jgi:hypothetical protein